MVTILTLQLVCSFVHKNHAQRPLFNKSSPVRIAIQFGLYRLFGLLRQLP